MQSSTKADHETIQEVLVAIFNSRGFQCDLPAISWCKVVDEMDLLLRQIFKQPSILLSKGKYESSSQLQVE